MDLLWSKIYDVIIKSLIAGEHSVIQGMKRNCSYRTNCFELYGFDVLLDSDLKPWLLEINLSPSLACDAVLDTKIKTKLIADAFNLVGLKKFDRRKESMNKMKNRIKGSYKTKTGNIFGTKNGEVDEQELFKLMPPQKELERIINELNEP